MMIFLSKEKGAVSPSSITFFDFETTSKEPAIAEILTGYFKTVDPVTRQKIDELKVFMKPRRWLKESYEIHGISEETASRFQEKKPMMRDIFRYFKKHHGSLFICHANYTVFGIKGYFDWQVLKTECLYMDVLHHFNQLFGNYDVFSTHTMARDRKILVKNFKLKTLADHYNFQFNAHDCIEDTLATEHIFWEILDTKDLLTIMEEE